MKKIDIVVRDNIRDLGNIVFPPRTIECNLIIKTLRPNYLFAIDNAMILSESEAYMYHKKPVSRIDSTLLLENNIENQLSITKSINIAHNAIIQEMIHPTKWKELGLNKIDMTLYSAVSKIDTVKYRKLSEIDELMLEELDNMKLEDIDYVEA